MALLAGDPVTVSRVEGRLALGPGWASSILQRLVAELWTDPEAAVRTGQAASIYSKRRQALIDSLQRRNIVAFRISGLNLWIPVDRESSVVAGLVEKG